MNRQMDECEKWMQREVGNSKVCSNEDDEDVPVRKEVIPTIFYSVISISIHFVSQHTFI
jgi:hypothetical protein